jgi:uncharacterized membrane protein YqhA
MIIRWFESALWNSRYIVIVPVIACVLLALLLVVLVTSEAIQLPGHLYAFIDASLQGEARAKIYSDGVANIAKIIDGYLFATILLIFAMGLYELFISKIDIAENSEVAARILLIQSIDDLKDRLAKVVFLILIVTFFEYALRQTYETPLALLELAAGIVMIAAAIWLTGRNKH